MPDSDGWVEGRIESFERPPQFGAALPILCMCGYSVTSCPYHGGLDQPPSSPKRNLPKLDTWTGGEPADRYQTPEAGRQAWAYAAIDEDGVWVKFLRPGEKPIEMSPDLARELAEALESAADDADRMRT